MKSKSYATFLWLLPLISGFGFISHDAVAGLCASTTSCTLVLSEGNTGSGFGTGNFGTVDLELSGTTAAITIDLADGFQLVNTGFPGSVGFADSLGGGLTVSDFSSVLYSGAVSDATKDLHFDGFGYSNDAVATTGPHAGDGLNSVSFSVSGSGLTDINQLLNAFGGPAGQGPVYFVADVYNTNTDAPGAGNTGLVAVTGSSIPVSVPEPSSLAIFGVGLIGLGMLFQRKKTG